MSKDGEDDVDRDRNRRPQDSGTNYYVGRRTKYYQDENGQWVPRRLMLKPGEKDPLFV